MARALAQPPPDKFHERSEPPEGFEWGWERDTNWRLATEDEQRERHCRRPGCTRRPVAAILRPLYGSGGRHWWLYCDWHLYGHRIANGQVESRRLRPLEEPAS